MERKDAIKIILLNLLVSLGMIFFLQVSQKNIADIYMEYAVSAKGEETVLLFSNFIYGGLLKGLYTLFPRMSWYGITQYIFVLVSFVIITCLIATRFSGKVGTLINCIFLATFGYECYYNPEYTKTALLMTISAILLIVYYSQKKRLVGCVFGSVWAIWGGFINIRVFFIVLAILGTFIVVWLVCEKKKNGLIVLINVLLVSGIVYIANIANDKYCESSYLEKDVEWDAVAGLYDFGWPEYMQHRAEYEALNITEDMYLSLEEGRFVAITWEQIQNIANVRTEHKYGMSNILQRNNIAEMLTASANYAMCVFCFIFLFSNTKRKMVKILGVMLVFAISIFLTYYFDAEHSGWVLYAISLVLSVVLLLGVDNLEYEYLKYHAFPILGMLLYFFYLNNPIVHMGTSDWKATKEMWVEQRGENVEAQYIYDLKSFVATKPMFVSGVDLSLEENMYIVSGLDYLNHTEKANAFSVSVTGQYASNSYWCEEVMSIYAISNSVQLRDGYYISFVEMGRADGVIIYDVNIAY